MIVAMTDNIICRFLLFLITVVLVDFYYFPTTFTFFPSGNTKLYLALLGIVALIVGLRLKARAVIDKRLTLLLVLASMVSLCSLFSTTINHTSDDTYVSYVVSASVWLSAAYLVNSCIRAIYGKASVIRICNFIIVVCVIQCVIAILAAHSPVVQHFVDRITDTVWLRSVNRIYGIGASLDTAGVHFALALIMIAYILEKKANSMSYGIIFLYILAFFFIVIVGNMVARVTTVGAVISLVYLFYKSNFYKLQVAPSLKKVFLIMGGVGVGVVPLTYHFYVTNVVFAKNIRFAFEGFFSLVKEGTWNVASNNTLKSMIVFPESLKTWLVGDGYIVSPLNDPYYTGAVMHGYYMNTDIGYLRFIFYFGLIGLLLFSIYIICVNRLCQNSHPEHRALFFLFLIANFIVWLKVSTDLFFAFAILFLADQEEQQTPTVVSQA